MSLDPGQQIPKQYERWCMEHSSPTYFGWLSCTRANKLREMPGFFERGMNPCNIVKNPRYEAVEWIVTDA